MSTAIWKLQLSVTDYQEISLPAGARLLSVANQRGTLCLWAWVDPNADSRHRWTVTIIGTGNPIEAHPGDFLGTVVIEPFVWHVFAKFHG